MAQDTVNIGFFWLNEEVLQLNLHILIDWNVVLCPENSSASLGLDAMEETH
jgi:hypothetical protein